MHHVYFHGAFSQMNNIWEIARKRNKCSLSISIATMKMFEFFYFKNRLVFALPFSLFVVCRSYSYLGHSWSYSRCIIVYSMCVCACVSLQHCAVLMIMQSIYCPHTSVSVSYIFVRTRVRNNNNKHWAAFGAHAIREL